MLEFKYIERGLLFGGCSQPRTSVDYILLDLHNSSHYTRPNSIIVLIIID